MPIFIVVICRTHTGHRVREESNGISPFSELFIVYIVGIDIY